MLIDFNGFKEAALAVLLMGLLAKCLNLRLHFLLKVALVLVESPLTILPLFLLGFGHLNISHLALKLLRSDLVLNNLSRYFLGSVIDHVACGFQLVLCHFYLLFCLALLL